MFFTVDRSEAQRGVPHLECRYSAEARVHRFVCVLFEFRSSFRCVFLFEVRKEEENERQTRVEETKLLQNARHSISSSWFEEKSFVCRQSIIKIPRNSVTV